MPAFFSLDRDKSAIGIDVLAQALDFPLCYALRPFKLVPLVLRKFEQENMVMILLVPHWPKEAWFFSPLCLSAEPPPMFLEIEDLLVQGPVVYLKVVSLVSEESVLKVKG